MSCGVLSAVDKQLLHAQTWMHHRLAGLATSPHHQLLPLHPKSLLALIRELGIPAQATRVAALRQLVL